jgi:hypothetical protein
MASSENLAFLRVPTDKLATKCLGSFEGKCCYYMSTLLGLEEFSLSVDAYEMLETKEIKLWGGHNSETCQPAS